MFIKTLRFFWWKISVMTYPVHFSRLYPAGFQRGCGFALIRRAKTLFYSHTFPRPHGAERWHSFQCYLRKFVFPGEQTFFLLFHLQYLARASLSLPRRHVSTFEVIEGKETMWALKWLFPEEPRNESPTGGAVQCAVIPALLHISLHFIPHLVKELSLLEYTSLHTHTHTEDFFSERNSCPARFSLGLSLAD